MKFLIKIFVAKFNLFMIDHLNIEAKNLSQTSCGLFSTSLKTENKKKISTKGDLIIYKKQIKNREIGTEKPYLFLQIASNGRKTTFIMKFYNFFSI